MAGFMDKVRNSGLVGAAMVGLALSMMGATLGGCNSVSKDEHLALQQENEEIRHQLSTQQAAAKQAESQLSAAQAENAQLKNQLATAQPAAQEPWQGNEPTRTPRNGSPDGPGRKIGTVNFPSGSVTVDKVLGGQLDSVVSALKGRYADYDVRVEGHADGAQPKRSKFSSNEEISQARAESVKRYLVSKGISSSRISTTGLGSTTTKVSRDGRRADVIVIGAN